MVDDPRARAERAAQQAAGRVARKMREISDQARIPRTQGLVIPVLDADPDPTDPTNMWRFEDGRLRVRRADGGVDEFLPATQYRPALPTFASAPSIASGWRIWARTDGTLQFRLADDSIITLGAGGSSSGTGGEGSTGSGSSGTPKPADPKVVKRVKTYSAAWGRSMCPVHGPEQGGSLYYGRWSSTHGQRKVMLGLPDGTIRSDLSGATIRSVEFHFRNDHAYSHAGVEIKMGGHNKSSAPGGYSSVRENVFRGHWPKSGEGKYWRPAPTWFGEALRDGNIRGFTINQRSDSVGHYGAMAWGTFKVRITYTVEA